MKPTALFVLALLAAPAAGCSLVGAPADFGAPLQTGATAPRSAYAEEDRPRLAGRDAYAGAIAREAAANGVPAELGTAMVAIESNYNPRLTGQRGEIGLMQIKLETARSLGYDGDRAGLYDPETNIRYGMRYLGAARRAAGGDVCGTVLRYQGGLRATRHSDWTRQSCGRAMALMRG